jgi:hypothetical protein
VQPSTPLGPDQVNVILFIYFPPERPTGRASPSTPELNSPDSIGMFLGEVFRRGVVSSIEPGAVSADLDDWHRFLSRSARTDIGCQTGTDAGSHGWELEVLKRLVSEQERTSSVLTEARYLLGCVPRRVVRALYVRVRFNGNYGPNGVPLDLTPLSVKSGKIPGFLIKVKTIEAPEFPKSRFADSTVLSRKFDIVFIGGSDGALDGLRDLTGAVIERSFINFHQAGGKIVFLHDSVCVHEKNDKLWDYFRDQMGPHRLLNEVGSGLWTEVRRKNPSGPRPLILTTPFELPDPFPVAPTHSQQMHAAENALLIGRTNDSTYYVERNGIAFCETGHTSWLVTKHEWRFLVNMTYHLTESGKPRS